MIRSAILVAMLALTACAGHTPPPACRGEIFSLNAPLAMPGAADTGASK